LRQAISPKKSFRPLHSSLSVEEFERNTDNDETKKIIEEYRSRGGVTRRSLSSKNQQRVLPPFPSELSDEYEDEDYGEGDVYEEEEESFVTRESDESDYSYLEEEETQSSSIGNEDDSIIQNALQLFCEQKRNTIQNIKAKKAQTKDLRMF
jgi:hypothetical protein